MAKIGLPKGSGKRLKVREKSVKSQGILKLILSGNPAWKDDMEGRGLRVNMKKTKLIISESGLDLLCGLG